MEKICFVLGNFFKYVKGGSEYQVYLIGNYLYKKYDLYYVYEKLPKWYIDSNSSISPQKIEEPFTLYTISRRNYGFFGRYGILNFFELLKILNEINPNILYQRVKSVYTGICAYWAKKNNSKFVYHIASDSDVSKLNNKNILSYPSHIITSKGFSYGLENADMIIAQTRQQQKLLKQNFNRGSIVIPNGHLVPLPPFKKTNPPIIAWIANIKQLKQPEIFIKLAAECHDLNAQFVYAGRPSSGGYQNMLFRETKKLDNLTYLGEIPFVKTNELLSKASILVNTSTYEGFPNPYIQAWMRETPVVSLNVDPDDILKRYKVGFHSGNFEQLVKDVRYLIENEDVRKKMGRRAREYAVEHHDIEKIGKRYLEVFEELVGK